MEETNFVLLWKEHYQKIDQSLTINKRLLRETTNQKAQSALRALIRFKAGGIVAAVLYLALLGAVLVVAFVNYSAAANYFIVSIGAIFLINVKALADYIKHIIWINRIDYSGSISAIQQQLTKLQLSTYQHTRVMFLQLPFWTTFFLSSKWFPQTVGWGYIVIQVLVTGLFTLLAYWLYKNITVQNAHKKWVRILINGSGEKRVAKALEFYHEIEQFQLEG
jgi:lysylphosphatidylglycerol synthetase-like protein (DUF2156 family)